MCVYTFTHIHAEIIVTLIQQSNKVNLYLFPDFQNSAKYSRIYSEILLVHCI